MNGFGTETIRFSAPWYRLRRFVGGVLVSQGLVGVGVTALAVGFLVWLPAPYVPITCLPGRDGSDCLRDVDTWAHDPDLQAVHRAAYTRVKVGLAESFPVFWDAIEPGSTASEQRWEALAKTLPEAQARDYPQIITAAGHIDEAWVRHPPVHLGDGPWADWVERQSMAVADREVSAYRHAVRMTRFNSASTPGGVHLDLPVVVAHRHHAFKRSIGLCVAAGAALMALMGLCGGLLLAHTRRRRPFTLEFTPHAVIAFGQRHPLAEVSDDVLRGYLAAWRRYGHQPEGTSFAASYWDMQQRRDASLRGAEPDPVAIAALTDLGARAADDRSGETEDESR